MKITINSIEQIYELDRALFNQIKGYLGITSTKNIYRTNVSADLPIAFADAVTRFQEKNPFEIWDEQRKQETKTRNDKEGADRATWWISQGLLPSDHNLQLIYRFLREKAGGFLCAADVDSAVEYYRDQLEWKPKPGEPVVPVTPAPEPPPPPVILSDGSEQLPLGTTSRSRHTLVQLHDLDARERAEKNKSIRARNNEVAAANKPAVLEVV